MEYRLANYSAVRRLYERWIEWEPDTHAWNAYIKFELQANEVARAREIFHQYVNVRSHLIVQDCVVLPRFLYFLIDNMLL